MCQTNTTQVKVTRFFSQYVLFVHENIPLFVQIFKLLVQTCSAIRVQEIVVGHVQKEPLTITLLEMFQMYPLYPCGNRT